MALIKQIRSRLYFFQHHSRFWMATVLIMSDLISLMLAFSLAIFLRVQLPGGNAALYQYLELFPVLGIFIIIYTWRGLYPGVGLSPVDELRCLAGTTSSVFLILISFTFWSQVAENLSRLVFGLAWVCALILTQFDRWMVRIWAIKMDLWGEPVVIVGNGPESQHITDFLNKSIHLGLRPMIKIDGHGSLDKTITTTLRQAKIRTAILVVQEISDELKSMLVREQRFGFQQLILISSLSWISSLGVIPYDLEGILALEVRRNLLHFWYRVIKRCQDIVLSLLGIILLPPIFLVIALAIKLDTPGPVFYQHKRLGRHGKTIAVWKFRTMVLNADQILNDYFSQFPELRREWESSQKLMRDPRISGVGKILRKWSIDELPQLWNVLRGDMSIVGPRPIVADEVKFYKNSFSIYKQVRPGMTGLWQVSGRNDSSYEARTRFDEYYVCNWSIWLDLYIIIRTARVVLSHRGAY